MSERGETPLTLAEEPLAPLGIRPFRKLVVILDALGHLVSDGYWAFFPPLLPEFQRRFHLTKFMCGSLAAAQATTVSLIQPLLGFASDRMRTRRFLVLGPAVGAAFCSLIGNVPSYWWLMALLTAGGLGIGAFHPSGAALASVAGGRKPHLALSIWSAGGVLGAAAGYKAVVLLVGRLGLRGLGLAMFPGLLVSALLFKFVPKRQKEGAAPVSPTLSGINVTGPLGLLCGIALCRALISVAISTFTPILLSERGYPLAAGGNALSLYMLLGAAGNLFAGWLAEKTGAKPVIFSSLLLSFPALVGFTLVRGPAYLLLLMAAGFCLVASSPTEIGLAQRSVPQQSAAISGVFTGTIWGIAGLAMMGAGALADRIGTLHTMVSLYPLALVAAFLAAALPRSFPEA